MNLETQHNHEYPPITRALPAETLFKAHFEASFKVDRKARPAIHLARFHKDRHTPLEGPLVVPFTVGVDFAMISSRHPAAAATKPR